MSHEDKLIDLKGRIKEKERLLVAYSGGVDSTLLAKVAHDVLGDRAVAVIIDSETYGTAELNEAIDVAESLGLKLMVEGFSILDSEDFVQNPAARCYICKKKAATILWNLAREKGIKHIADGVNIDDLKDYRPGISASNEMNIWHPFVDSGITKEDIRYLASKMGLPVWNKPSSACLASRIPYGERITEEGLKMIEEAEGYLRSLGFGQLRVRAQGRTARIELLNSDLEKAIKCRESIVSKLKSFGFKYIALDLEGFRSGSMNEVL